MNKDKILRKIKMFQKSTKGSNPKMADGLFSMVALLSNPTLESIYKIGHSDKRMPKENVKLIE